jgi:uncharacterized membrane protein YbhN (UPF0104 family)
LSRARKPLILSANMRATVPVPEGNAPWTGAKKVSLKWTFVCLAVTLAALFFIFRRIHPGELFDAIRTMRPGWFVAAFALYGIVFFPAAWRWHLALRMNNSAAGFSPAVRYSIVGHFFYLILFGGVGGDTAKAAAYARRYELSLPKILAAVSLDRLMGSGALICFAAMVFSIEGAHGGFAGVKSISFRGSAWWLLLVPVTAALLFVIAKRSRRESIVNRFVTAFLESGRRLVTSPKIILPGLFCGLLMQAGLNGVLALNLQAVTHEPLPWLRLAWTFPVITVVSGLPITFAGIGARDGAAIALLGWCGVAGVDAAAMALLTLCVSVLWALIGGLVLWREANHLQNENVSRKAGGTGVDLP